jgi:hypothetical protein
MQNPKSQYPAPAGLNSVDPAQYYSQVQKAIRAQQIGAMFGGGAQAPHQVGGPTLPGMTATTRPGYAPAPIAQPQGLDGDISQIKIPGQQQSVKGILA